MITAFVFGSSSGGTNPWKIGRIAHQCSQPQGGAPLRQKRSRFQSHGFCNSTAWASRLCREISGVLSRLGDVAHSARSGRALTIRGKRSRMTGRGTTWQPTEALVAQLNRKLAGWANYFRLGSAAKAFAAVDRHASRWLRHWLRIKHKVRQGAGHASPSNS